MSVIFRIGGLLLLLLLAPPLPAVAELYYWKDDNGVRHYTNTKPPDGVGATVLMNEIPYDPETDDQRRRQEKAMLEEAEKEALQERLEEAERNAEEARRQAQEAKRKADRLEEAIEEREDDGGYGIYYPYPGHRPPGWRPPGHRPPGSRPPAWQPPRPDPRRTTPRKPRQGEHRRPSQEQAH